MAAFANYSTTPSANVTIGTINIDENCAAANINDAIRAILAEGKQLSDIVAAIDVSNYIPKSGGAFTGSITRSGAGAYTYYADSTLVGGLEYVQPTATALPTSPAEGTKVYQY